MTEINVNLKLSITDENGDAIITPVQAATLSGKVYSLLACALDQLLLKCPCEEEIIAPCTPTDICSGLELIIGEVGTTNSTGLYPYLGIIPISTNTPIDGHINVLAELGNAITSSDVLSVVNAGGLPAIRVIKDLTVDYSTLSIFSMPNLLGGPGAFNNNLLAAGKYRIISSVDEGTNYHVNGTFLLSFEAFDNSPVIYTVGLFNYSNFSGVMFLDLDVIEGTENLNAMFIDGHIDFNTSAEAINLAKVAKLIFTLNATGCDNPLVKTLNGLTGEIE